MTSTHIRRLYDRLDEVYMISSFSLDRVFTGTCSLNESYISKQLPV